MKVYLAYARGAVASTADPFNVCRLLFYLFSAFILINMGPGMGHEKPVWVSTPFWAFAHYFFIGIFAATVANSTGAGGGIVFIPAFISLGLSPSESLATSIAIQCFGMTSGSLAWLSFIRRDRIVHTERWQSFWPILSISMLGSWGGMLSTQRWMPNSPINIELLFSLFSLLVGVIILHRALNENRQPTTRVDTLTWREAAELLFICLGGGAITAWLSIGVGEILAVYLLFRRFHISLAIACAVCVTSGTVLVGVQHYLFTAHTINLNVLMYAAPGALIGGALARRLALFLGGRRLKLMMAGWIILSASMYWFV